jgi:hypothetical protein
VTANLSKLAWAEGNPSESSCNVSPLFSNDCNTAGEFSQALFSPHTSMTDYYFKGKMKASAKNISKAKNGNMRMPTEMG